MALTILRLKIKHLSFVIFGWIGGVEHVVVILVSLKECLEMMLELNREASRERAENDYEEELVEAA